MNWTTILAIIEALIQNPALKTIEEAELNALRAQYASNPVILAILNGLAAAVGL